MGENWMLHRKQVSFAQKKLMFGKLIFEYTNAGLELAQGGGFERTDLVD